MPDREALQARHVMDVKAIHQALTMGLHRLDAGVQQPGDLLARLALGNELEDLALARRELLQRPDPVGRLVQEGGDQVLGDGRAQEQFAADGRGQGQLQLGELAAGASTDTLLCPAPPLAKE